jgi:hypothetical protein
MGNFISTGETTKIGTTIRNGDSVRQFADIKLDNPMDKQLGEMMMQLDGDDVEVVVFSLSQNEKHPYTPSEERLMKLIEMIDTFNRRRPKKGWGKEPPPEERKPIIIKTMMINLTFDDRTKELAAKLLMMHIALIMSKLNMQCEHSCLMGSMGEFKDMFGKINDMANLLK